MEVQKRINNTSAPHKAPVSRFHRQSGYNTFDNVIFEGTQGNTADGYRTTIIYCGRDALLPFFHKGIVKLYQRHCPYAV